MGGFGGLPATIAKMDALGRSARSATKDVKGLGDAIFAAIKADDDRRHRQAQEANEATKQREQQKRMQMEANLGPGITILPGSPGLAPGELFSPEQINQLGQRIANLAPGEKVAKSLEDLSGRIEKLMGPDNYMAKLLQIEIPYLRKGARSADEATALVQSVLIPFMAGFQRELANPTTPPEMRQLLIEIMNLAQSGQHQLDNLAKRFEESNAAQKDIDKTVNRLNDQQSKMNKFVEDIGKGVDRIEQKVVQGGHEEYGMQKFSDHLEQVTGGLGTSH